MCSLKRTEADLEGPQSRLGDAKAQILANEEGRELLVFSFKDSGEAVRVFPRPGPVAPKT